MERKFAIKCKIVLVDGNKRFFSKGRFVYTVSGNVRRSLIALPVPLRQEFGMRFHLLARLFRLGVHHFIQDGVGGYYCVYNKQCARFSASGALIGQPIGLRGGRPLRVDIYRGALIYGEYRSNPERSAVAVYAYDGWNKTQLFLVDNVRHIHTVRVKDDKVYFSTGDYGDEAGIWYWDGKNIHRLLQGGQQRRAVDFLLAEDGIYYGTDTPLEQNYIYKSSYDGELKRLQAVNGSVFYMSEQANRYWLATVVEPSEVNTSKLVELWASNPNDSGQWSLVSTFKKDIWPVKLFQYGQVQFPYISKSVHNELWFYLQGVECSGTSILRSLD